MNKVFIMFFLAISMGYCLDFSPISGGGSGVSDLKSIDENKPYCFKNKPITKVARLAVAAAGAKSCSDKAEAILYSKTKQKFIKLKKDNMSQSAYNQAYELWLQAQ